MRLSAFVLEEKMIITTLAVTVVLCIIAWVFLNWQTQRTYKLLYKEARARNIHIDFQNELKELSKTHPSGIDNQLIYMAFKHAEYLGKVYGTYKEKQLNNITPFKAKLRH